MRSLMHSLRVVWACAKKDIKSALTERVFTIVSIFIPVNILILLSLFVSSGGLAPTAVVMEDTGPYAQQLYDAMSHAHSFRLRQTSATEAQQLISTGRIVAVVTIPADFDTQVQRNQPVQVDVEVNNLNTDFTNDIRRAIPLSITAFYANASPNTVTVTPREQDFYPQDTDYVPYLGVSILVIALMIGGGLQAGIGAAREWERDTVKELLLSPASRWSILTGKLLGAFLLSLASVIIVLAVLIGIIGVRPAHWGEMVFFTLLSLIIFLALGVCIGTVLKVRPPVVTLVVGIAFPLFLLSGAFGPISFNTPALQTLARLFPVYYAIVLEQHAFHDFTLNTLGLWTNALIVGGFALLLIAMATVIFRRSTVAH
jgi:ABC-2 type transport system permease protein